MTSGLISQILEEFDKKKEYWCLDFFHLNTTICLLNDYEARTLHLAHGGVTKV